MDIPPEERAEIERLIAALDSIVEGDRAVEELIAHGPQVAPDVAHFLLESPPRSLALPRCRAVRVLGELGAYSSLLTYFQRYTRPADAAVLFAEDAVRSTAALELLHCSSGDVFPALLQALRDRATAGLVEAIGEWRRPEAVPTLFELLEDDLCRDDAKKALRKMPGAAQPYAVLLLRGSSSIPISAAAASRRRRATLQLLAEWGVGASEWEELRGYLWDDDPDCIIATARIGFKICSESSREEILEEAVSALIENATKMNGAQEMESIELLDEHATIAQAVAARVAVHRHKRGEGPNWRSPLWRILRHLLGDKLVIERNGAA